jgi:hypothetical protein
MKMSKKKKTVEALASSGGNPKNNKLSVRHLNTPFRIGQSILPKLTGVYIENQDKQNHCFHCRKCFDWLPFCAVNKKEVLRGVYAGVCKGCIDSLSILPPNLQKRFWQKVERNLKIALEVKADV